MQRIRERFHVALAEVDHQDLWQRASLAITTVSASPGVVESVLDEVERFIWAQPDVEVASTERFWLDNN